MHTNTNGQKTDGFDFWVDKTRFTPLFEARQVVPLAQQRGRPGSAAGARWAIKAIMLMR
jgi:hypothetical protein